MRENRKKKLRAKKRMTLDSQRTIEIKLSEGSDGMRCGEEKNNAFQRRDLRIDISLETRWLWGHHGGGPGLTASSVAEHAIPCWTS